MARWSALTNVWRRIYDARCTHAPRTSTSDYFSQNIGIKLTSTLRWAEHHMRSSTAYYLESLASPRSMQAQCRIWLQEQEVMRELLQQQLKQAQDHMKKQADKRHTDRYFEVGGVVFL